MRPYMRFLLTHQLEPDDQRARARAATTARAAFANFSQRRVRSFTILIGNTLIRQLNSYKTPQHASFFVLRTVDKTKQKMLPNATQRVALFIVVNKKTKR